MPPITTTTTQRVALETDLDAKADLTYVDAQLALKADDATAASTGDVTASGLTAAGPTILGRETGTGAIEELTIGSGLSLSAGTLTASGGGGGVSDGDKGDITVSGTGTIWTVDPQAITFAKIQDLTDNRLLGRSAGTGGSAMEITVGSGLSLSGGALTAEVTQAEVDAKVDAAAGAFTTLAPTSAVAASGSTELVRKGELDDGLATKAGTGAITDGDLTMSTDRLLGRDTTGTGAIEELSAGAGLSITGGALVAEVTQAELDAKVDAASGAFTTAAPTSAVAATASNHLLRKGEADAAFQPLDSDLTALAALTTHSFGRGVLEASGRVAAANALGVPAVIFSEAGNPVRTVGTSSTAENTLTSFTISGNTLGTDGMVVVDFSGYILQNSGGSNGSTFRIKYGSTTLLQAYAGTTLGNSATPYPITMRCILFAAGSTALQGFSLEGILGGNATPTAGRGWWLGRKGDIANTNNTMSTENSTGDLTFSLTHQWSVSSASSYWRVEHVHATYYPGGP